MKRLKQLEGTATRSMCVDGVFPGSRLIRTYFSYLGLLSSISLMLCILGLTHPAAFAQASLADPATPEQIRQYLKLSGEMEAYRARWIAALDKNRSIGEPYWPEAFWTEIKHRMQDADLTPMLTAWLQHTVSRELMQQVLDTYQSVGAEHFQGSPACFKLGETQETYKSEMDKLTLANTYSLISQVYTVYKPQIKAARAKYIAEHPDWKDK